MTERASEADPELQLVRSCLTSDDWNEAPTVYAAARYELANVGFVVMRGTRIVVPTSLRSQVLALAHEGHQGISKTKSRLRTKVWWPNMDKDAENVCRRCHSCQVVSQPVAAPPVQPTTLPNGPWQHLAVDLLGPLPSGNSLLVLVDYYSRYFEVDVIRSTSTDVVVDKLGAHFARHGFPISLRSDNGPQFVAAVFQDFLTEHGVEHRRTTPYWPRANGEVERAEPLTAQDPTHCTAGTEAVEVGAIPVPDSISHDATLRNKEASSNVAIQQTNAVEAASFGSSSRWRHRGA